MGEDVVVKNVIIFNRIGDGVTRRLSYATISLINRAGRILESFKLGSAEGIPDFNIPFGLNEAATSVVAWNRSSPTGEPLLSDVGKINLRAHFRKNKDILDASIALVFGNKTTIGQVCSFAKGLASKTVTTIPGFCCLDAPYQSKIEEWGEKVSSWDVRMKKEDCYCDISAKLTT